jgi:hypothetical protein
VSTARRILRIIEPHPGEHFKDKIIAVSLAFVVWFAVNTEQTGLQLFQAVPVSTINLPEELAFAENVQDTLTIRLSGPNSALEAVSAARRSTCRLPARARTSFRSPPRTSACPPE